MNVQSQLDVRLYPFFILSYIDKCPPLKAPHFGDFHSTCQIVDCNCTYSCGNEYDLIGTEVVWCQEVMDTGVWSHPAPWCKRTCIVAALDIHNNYYNTNQPINPFIV